MYHVEQLRNLTGEDLVFRTMEGARLEVPAEAGLVVVCPEQTRMRLHDQACIGSHGIRDYTTHVPVTGLPPAESGVILIVRRDVATLAWRSGRRDCRYPYTIVEGGEIIVQGLAIP